MKLLEQLTLQFLAGLFQPHNNASSKEAKADGQFYLLVALSLAILAFMAVISWGVTN